MDEAESYSIFIILYRFKRYILKGIFSINLIQLCRNTRLQSILTINRLTRTMGLFKLFISKFSMGFVQLWVCYSVGSLCEQCWVADCIDCLPLSSADWIKYLSCWHFVYTCSFQWVYDKGMSRSGAQENKFIKWIILVNLNGCLLNLNVEFLTESHK